MTDDLKLKSSAYPQNTIDLEKPYDGTAQKAQTPSKPKKGKGLFIFLGCLGLMFLFSVLAGFGVYYAAKNAVNDTKTKVSNTISTPIVSQDPPQENTNVNQNNANTNNNPQGINPSDYDF